MLYKGQEDSEEIGFAAPLPTLLLALNQTPFCPITFLHGCPCFNHVHSMKFLKKTKRQSVEAFQMTEHLEVPGGWHIHRGQLLHIMP